MFVAKQGLMKNKWIRPLGLSFLGEQKREEEERRREEVEEEEEEEEERYGNYFCMDKYGIARIFLE